MLTAVLGIPILIGMVWAGGWIMALGMASLAAIGVWEMDRIFRNRGSAFFPWLTVFWVWAIFLAVLLRRPVDLPMLLGFGLAGFWTLWQRDVHGFDGAVASSWAAVYLGWFFSFMLAIRELPRGRELLFGFFIVVWSTDTVAYFIGRAFGHAKLLEGVSPGKTWAGSVSGTLAGIAAGVLLARWGHVSMAQGGLVGGAISVIGQVGDLIESNLKRFAGVKDSGALLPGHGGILDRFDSALYALPFAYYLLRGLGIG